MSSPPTTPRRRQSSTLINEFSPNASPTLRFATPGRRSSTTYTQTSPVSARFSRGEEDLVDSSALGGGGDSLGNLADELADADEWDGDEEYDDGDTMDEPFSPSSSGTATSNGHLPSADGIHPGDMARTRDSGIDVTSTSSPLAAETGTARKSSGLLAPGSHISPVQKQRRSRHRRQVSDYDGSDYGDSSDLEEVPLISRALEAKMAAVEGLARRGMETNGSAEDAIVERVVERLRDLGSQAGVENAATRLSTAHSAITTHLAHQTRAITALTTPLLSPLAPLPPPEILDSLLPLIGPCISSLADLSPDLHHNPAQPSPLHAIHTLAKSSADLASTLSQLGDTLHMSRQDTTTAARRLRVVRELMTEWKRENEAKEEGVRWIESGGWDERLRTREAGKTCERVVGGFEEVCDRWRERLVAQAAAA